MHKHVFWGGFKELAHLGLAQPHALLLQRYFQLCLAIGRCENSYLLLIHAFSLLFIPNASYQAPSLAVNADLLNKAMKIAIFTIALT
ncbi:MAG: hypothetical protein WC982_11080 [Advenella sp.]